MLESNGYSQPENKTSTVTVKAPPEPLGAYVTYTHQAT
jgi:hypothetical protein